MTYTKKQLDLIKELKPVDTEELYNDMLNECYGRVKICGYEYLPSFALSEVDPLAYNCGMNDYIDLCVGETLTDEIDGRYYSLDEVNDLLESNEDESEE